MNPYNPCVFNDMKNGKQLMITFHVDDLKVSHMDPFEIKLFACYLSRIYGEKLVVHQGKVHDYLVINFDLYENGKVKIYMITLLENILESFPEGIVPTATLLAGDHLFKIRDKSEAVYLPEEQAVAFYHNMAQLLYIAPRWRIDIHTAVTFLTTRVKKLDEDEWMKLKRGLKYTKGTKHMKLTTSVDSLSMVKLWVYALYNTHEYHKGHTGDMMNLGEGAVTSIPNKQKLSVNISTEGELIGADDALGKVI